MSDLKSELKSGTRMPPYTSFSTLLTLVEELKTNGLPPQIDNSVLKRFSGSVRTQLLSGLKFLGLMTDDKKPTPALNTLVEVYGTDDFKVGIRNILLQAYAFLAPLDLKTATPTMFADAFRNTFGGQDAVLSKCRTFYLQAARYAGVELGQRITAGTAGTRPSPGAPKPPRKARLKREREDESERPDSNQHVEKGNVSNGMMEKLLEKFPKLDPKWDATIQKAWFDGFNKLMASVEAEKK